MGSGQGPHWVIEQRAEGQHWAVEIKTHFLTYSLQLVITQIVSRTNINIYRCTFLSQKLLHLKRVEGQYWGQEIRRTFYSFQHILPRHSTAFVQRQGKSKSRSEGQGDKETRRHDRLNSSSVFAAKSWSRRVSTLVDTRSSNNPTPPTQIMSTKTNRRKHKIKLSNVNTNILCQISYLK